MSAERYAVLEAALCIGGNLHEGEVSMVRADAHDRELAALREELANETRRANVNALNARHAKQDLNSIQHRLTAAEQRNESLFFVLRDSLEAMRDLGERHGIKRCRELAEDFEVALAQPTESGASE